MKLLYITNAINGSGGLERVLAVKASYLADKLGYKVHILTLNKGAQQPFYEFSNNITFHDIKVQGNVINYFLSYKKGIKKVLKSINPAIISVCDDGLKGLLFPVFFGTKIPIIYERHVSKQIEIKINNVSVVHKIKSKLKLSFMDYGAGKFHKFVVLTNGNLTEWNLKNLKIIPNPLPFQPNVSSKLTNKKVLVVGKQSYQKGYDSLLEIWKLVHQKYPDWQLEVYGKLNPALGLEEKAKDFSIDESVKFYPPVKYIQAKYKEASIYVMTSRFEGFGMVLIEAMSYGVPCIAFDCPHGPADIITNGEDGFLVPNGDIDSFANAIIHLIENEEIRLQMGAMAKENVKRFTPDVVVLLWDLLFKNVVK